MLENSSLSLDFADGLLRATNRRSGSVTVLDCPGFILALAGEELAAADFDFDAPVVEEGHVTFAGRHTAMGIEAQVIYTLAADEPWFRKRVMLRAPEGTPTPDRLLVEVQADPPTPVRRVGYGLRGGPDREEQEGLDIYVVGFCGARRAAGAISPPGLG